MRMPRLRFNLLSLMVLIGLVAVALIIFKPAQPRYRLIEVFHRGANGAVIGRERMGFNLDAPVNRLRGFPDDETRYRDQVARLRALKAEYRITSPRGFHPNGEPIP